MERSRLSDFELEEREYMRKKREREKKALEEDLDETQVRVCVGRRACARAYRLDSEDCSKVNRSQYGRCEVCSNSENGWL